MIYPSRDEIEREIYLAIKCLLKNGGAAKYLLVKPEFYMRCIAAEMDGCYIFRALHDTLPQTFDIYFHEDCHPNTICLLNDLPPGCKKFEYPEGAFCFIDDKPF